MKQHQSVFGTQIDHVSLGVVALFLNLQVQTDSIVSVWVQKSRNNLLSGPEFQRKEDRRYGQLNLFIGVREIGADLRELCFVEEYILACDQKDARQKVLNQCDNKLSIRGLDNTSPFFGLTKFFLTSKRYRASARASIV